MNPRAALHLDAAARNQTIAHEMTGNFNPPVEPPHDDWIMTIVFYAALHFIDALIVEKRGQRPTTHIRRDEIVESDPALQTVATAYFALKDLSITARYQPVHSFPPSTVQQAFDQLQEIEQVVAGELETE